MIAADASVATRFFLGRQPILDCHGQIHGYELLFRSCDDNSAGFIDEHHATVQVIARAFSELGIQSVIGDTLGFINLDSRLLSYDIIDMLPAERIVLELLETTCFEESTVEYCRLLHEKGYRLALDDVTALNSAYLPVLPYVSYVKVDLLHMAEETLRELAAQLRPLNLTLLAEKVETRQQARLCEELGFTFFQGYYFARPEVLSGRNVDPSQRQMLRLSQLISSEASDKQIEAVFKEDSKLTYNLLRLVNSVAMGMRTHINSVHHAMLLLGRQQLQRWLALLLFAHRDGAQFPDPLTIMAANRGRLMELLVQEMNASAEECEQAFMTGIISLLEAVLEIPLPRIVDELKLAAPIRAALLERAGRTGQLLALIECIEQCDTTTLHRGLAGLELSLDQLTQAEIASMNWANAIGQEA